MKSIQGHCRLVYTTTNTLYFVPERTKNETYGSKYQYCFLSLEHSSPKYQYGLLSHLVQVFLRRHLFSEAFLTILSKITAPTALTPPCPLLACSMFFMTQCQFTSLKYKMHEGRNFSLFSAVSQCLAQNRHSVNTCWTTTHTCKTATDKSSEELGSAGRACRKRRKAHLRKSNLIWELKDE